MTPAERARLVELMRSIVLSDRSRPYDYREPRHTDGERPPAGTRWMTPRELAQTALDEIEARESG